MSVDLVLRDDEKAIFALRELYGKYGYSQYKMSKFEEYDLYALNKQFLVSDNIITFTDTDGKLLALKPDVTLSIIKNSKETLNGVQKVYYDENVYRVSKGTNSFKEIMQAGLECFGDVDDYLITEVLMLAVKSLKSISSDYALDISSLDVINCIFEKLKLKENARKQVVNYLSQKNVKGVEDVCQKEGVNQQDTELLKTLALCYGNVEKVVKTLSRFDLDDGTKDALKKLIDIVNLLSEMGFNEKINIDFSVVSDLNYYNGIVFKGFISGIPVSILSGGQYDNLMQKMNKKSKAIGFAVYLDELTKLANEKKLYDFDVAVEYGDKDKKQVFELVNNLIDNGNTVFADKKIPDTIKCKKVIKL